MARAYPQDKPEVYANEYLSTMRRWWSGDIGRLIRAWTPRIFPGCPPEAMMGFASNGGSARSNTTGWLTGLPDERATAASSGRRPLGGVMDQHFHELGLFGVEGGPDSGPAPGPGANSNWIPLATDPAVRGLLGRDATTTPGGWVALEDQIAIGLVNLRRAGRNVRNALPSAIRATSEGDLWFTALAFMAWSAGSPQAKIHVNPYADQLAPVEEKARWGAYNYMLAKKLASGGAAVGPSGSHANPAYSSTRTLQKLVAGQMLAIETHGNAAWFGDCLNSLTRPVVYDLLARAAVAQQVRGTIIPPAALSCRPLVSNKTIWIAAGVTVVAAAAAGVVTWKMRTREPDGLPATN